MHKSNKQYIHYIICINNLNILICFELYYVSLKYMLFKCIIFKCLYTFSHFIILFYVGDVFFFAISY